MLVSPATRDLDEARAELVELRQKLAYEEGQRQRLQGEVDALRRDAAEATARLDSILADG